MKEKNAEFLRIVGYILGVSYPLLALSTGARSVFQLFLRDDLVSLLPPLLSAFAAVCYMLAAIGFFLKRRWAWRLSVTMLCLETVMVVVIGTLSFAMPHVIGHTVWRHFGVDYGFFPLLQPILGLIYLFWPETKRAYQAGPGRPIRTPDQTRQMTGPKQPVGG